MTHEFDKRLMAISLQSPSTLLDGSTPLSAPKTTDVDDAEKNIASSFLWQAPSSEAVLFMGDRWVELHGYISQVLEKQQSATGTPALLAKKEVSKRHPSWLEYVLQLSRLRGYFTLYPSQETANAIVGIHNDLYDMPDEYVGGNARDEEFEDGLVKYAGEAFDLSSPTDILSTLPQGGYLLPLRKLPLLSWDGTQVDWTQMDRDALQYTHQFRREVGGCVGTETKKPTFNKHARDLFCSDNGKVQS